MSAHRRPALLLVGSGTQARQGALLADLARQADLLLLQPGSIDWQQPFVQDAVTIEPGNVAAVTAAAHDISRRRTVDGVLCYEEGLLGLAAEISHRTGHPGLSRSAAAVVTDKHAQRLAFAAHGLPTTPSNLVYDRTTGEAAAARIGYPVVLKPRNLSGSLGVSVARDVEDIAGFFEFATGSGTRDQRPSPGTLVEKYVDGPEFSVDCWVLDGESERVFTGLMLKGHAPHAINVGCVVGPGIADPAVLRAVEAMACRAALACGLDRTIANVDMRWDGQRAHVLEVNGRPAGEYLPYLAGLSSGVHVGATLALVASGQRPPVAPEPRRAVGVAFLSPRAPLHFSGLAVPDRLAEASWVLEVRSVIEPGVLVTPPPADPWGRAGHVLVAGVDAGEVEARVAEVWREVEVLGTGGTLTTASHHQELR